MDFYVVILQKIINDIFLPLNNLQAKRAHLQKQAFFVHNVLAETY